MTYLFEYSTEVVYSVFDSHYILINFEDFSLKISRKIFRDKSFEDNYYFFFGIKEGSGFIVMNPELKTENFTYQKFLDYGFLKEDVEKYRGKLFFNNLNLL